MAEDNLSKLIPEYKPLKKGISDDGWEYAFSTVEQYDSDRISLILAAVTDPNLDPQLDDAIAREGKEYEHIVLKCMDAKRARIIVPRLYCRAALLEQTERMPARYLFDIGLCEGLEGCKLALAYQIYRTYILPFSYDEAKLARDPKTIAREIAENTELQIVRASDEKTLDLDIRRIKGQVPACDWDAIEYIFSSAARYITKITNEETTPASIFTSPIIEKQQQGAKTIHALIIARQLERIGTYLGLKPEQILERIISAGEPIKPFIPPSLHNPEIQNAFKTIQLGLYGYD